MATTLNENIYPEDKVVRVQAISASGATLVGAGVLIAADEVLTAADLVWQPGVGAASSVTVDPKLNGPASVGQFQIDHFRYWPVAALNPANSQADFALLHLATPFTDPQPPVIQSSVFTQPTLFFDGSGGGVLFGYPASAGGTTMAGLSVSLASDSLTSTAHYLQGSAPTETGYVGGAVWLSSHPGSPAPAEPVGVATESGEVAEVTPPIIQLLNSWMAIDHSGTPQPGGPMAMPIPLLLHSISPDTGAPAIDPREAALVDKSSYLLSRPDVAAAGVDPAVHFANFGWHEGALPDPLFDPKYYLQHNPDVAGVGMDPLLHYALFGWHEGRDPSAGFSTSAYLANQRDVQLAGVNPLGHYLLFGVNEGRAIGPGTA
jgi:hypothetical protein